MNVDLVFFDDLKELSKYAEFLDSDVYIVAKNFKNEKELNELKQKIKGFKSSRCAFEICHLMKKASISELKKFSSKVDFIASFGGSPEMNKFASSHKAIDFLLAPCVSERFTFDTAIARTLADKKVPVAFSFAQFLNAYPKERSLLFKNYIFAAKIMRKFKVNALFFSCASKASELRCTNDFSAFATLFGFTELQGERFTGSFAESFLLGK